MESVKIKAHVGTDGILKLELPVDVVDTDVELVIVMHFLAKPLPTDTNKKAATAIFAQSRDEARKNGWPDGFFERTYGVFADNPIEREPQGEFEVRDAIL